MANLKEVKNRITSIVATQQITKAMKMVAAAKLRKSQDRIIQLRPFAKKISGILSKVATVEGEDENWYNVIRPEGNILIVVITSDRGLCGSFNSNIIKEAIRWAREEYAEQYNRGDVTFLPIGKKAYEYFNKRSYKTETQYWDLLSHPSFDKVSEAALSLIDAFKDQKYGTVDIAYNSFKNVATQILTTEQFLPILPPSERTNGGNVDYIYQPNRDEIMAGLVPKSLKIQLFKTVLDSVASENGARMTAMDKATENAGELLRDLRLVYNRTRQAMITKEILEIVGGAEALKNA